MLALSLMEDGFSIVSVGVMHERGVVARVVVRPQARLTVVVAPRGDRGRVEGVDLVSVARREGDVDGRRRVAFSDPKEGLAVGPDAAGASLELHQQRTPERGERSQVELLAPRVVAYNEDDVVDHRLSFRS